jgi:hypothetical protein
MNRIIPECIYIFIIEIDFRTVHHCTAMSYVRVIAPTAAPGRAMQIFDPPAAWARGLGSLPRATRCIPHIQCAAHNHRDFRCPWLCCCAYCVILVLVVLCTLLACYPSRRSLVAFSSLSQLSHTRLSPLSPHSTVSRHPPLSPVTQSSQ